MDFEFNCTVGDFLSLWRVTTHGFKCIRDTKLVSSKLCLYKVWHDRLPRLVWDFEQIDSENIYRLPTKLWTLIFSVVPVILFRKVMCDYYPALLHPRRETSLLRVPLPVPTPPPVDMQLHYTGINQPWPHPAPRRGTLLYREAPQHYPSPPHWAWVPQPLFHRHGTSLYREQPPSLQIWELWNSLYDDLPHPDMFQLVHYEACTFGKQVARILL